MSQYTYPTDLTQTGGELTYTLKPYSYLTLSENTIN